MGLPFSSRIVSSWFLTGLWLLLPWAGWAGQTLDLQAWIDKAWANHPALNRVQSDYRAVLALRGETRLWPDPMLELGYRNMGFSRFTLGIEPASGLSLMLTQRIPPPGLRGSMEREVLMGGERLRQEWRQMRRDRAAEVVQAYGGYYKEQRQWGVRREWLAELQAVYAVAQVRYTTGSGSQVDLLRLKTRLSRLQAEQQVAQRLVAAASQRMQVLLGENNLPAPEFPLELQPLAALPEWPELERRGGQQSPEWALAQWLIDSAQVQAEKATALRRPEIALSAGWTYNGGLPGMWAVQVGAEVPLFYKRRQKAHWLAAQERIAGAQQERLNRLRQWQLDLQESHAQAEAAWIPLSGFQEWSALARHTLTAALAAYRTGQGTFLDLFSALEMRFELEMNQIADQVRWWQALAEVQRLSGWMLLWRDDGEAQAFQKLPGDGRQ